MDLESALDRLSIALKEPVLSLVLFTGQLGDSSNATAIQMPVSFLQTGCSFTSLTQRILNVNEHKVKPIMIQTPSTYHRLSKVRGVAVLPGDSNLVLISDSFGNLVASKI